MSAARVFISDIDVTADIDREDWPEWLETSMKGAGLFDLEVKRFEFRLLTRCQVVPAYGQAVRVEIDKITRFLGVVFDLEDELSPAPLVICQPTAYTLNNVRAGTSGLDEAGTALRYLFEIPAPGVSLQEALELLLSRYDDNKDPRMAPAGAWTVVVHPSGESFTTAFAPMGLIGPAQGVNHYERPVISVPSSGGGYSIDPAPMTVPQEEWLQVRVSGDLPAAYAQIGIYTPRWWGTGGVEFIEERFLATDPVWTNRINGSSVFPYHTAPIDLFISKADWAAMRPLGWESTRLDQEACCRYIRFALGLPSDYPVTAMSCDITDYSWTFFWVDGYLYLVRWQSPTTDRISGRFVNEDMGTLLKLFMVVTGHWGKIEGTTVTATPRTATAGEVVLPSQDLALEQDRQRVAQDPGSLSIPRRDPSDPESTGLTIPLGMVTAINWWYSEQFVGRQTIIDKLTWPSSLLPEGIGLLSGAGGATIKDLDFSTDGTQFRITAIQEGQ